MDSFVKKVAKTIKLSKKITTDSCIQTNVSHEKTTALNKISIGIVLSLIFKLPRVAKLFLPGLAVMESDLKVAKGKFRVDSQLGPLIVSTASANPISIEEVSTENSIEDLFK